MIDCAGRGYKAAIQHISNRMIVREPEKRLTIKELAHSTLFKDIKVRLIREELEFLLETVKKASLLLQSR